jgi:hypothetical protein
MNHLKIDFAVEYKEGLVWNTRWIQIFSAKFNFSSFYEVLWVLSCSKLIYNSFHGADAKFVHVLVENKSEL